MSTINSPYHEPKDFGVFDLATSQANKLFTFDWDTDVIAQAKVVAVHRGVVVKTYTVGSGLTINNANRQIVLSVDGSDYDNLVGRRIELQCSFFVEGDVEVILSLDIVKTYL